MVMTRSEITARYRAKHREEINAKKAIYYAGHKEEWAQYRRDHIEQIKAYLLSRREHTLATQVQYNATHKEERANWHKRHRAEHAAEIKAERAAYYAEHRDKSQAYYIKHREERRAYGAQYHAEHRDQEKQYRAAHKEESRAWRSDHKDKLLAYGERYYAEHREERLAWKRAYDHSSAGRAASTASNIRRRSRLGNAVSVTTVREVQSEYGGICPYCNKPITKGHVDHIVPVSKGGTNARANLAWVCALCNQRKHNNSLLEFMIFRKRVFLQTGGEKDGKVQG